MDKSVLFYSSVANKDLFNTQKFYSTDIKILENLGYRVILSNRIRDALKFWKYTFFFGYFFRYSFFPGLIAKCFGKKVFFTGGIDALDMTYAGRKAYRIQVLFFMLCYFISTKCIIVSNSDFRNINNIAPKKRWDKLVISEHTVEVEKFINDQEKRKLFTTIGWQGNEGAIKRKGIDIALMIFTQLSKLDQFADYKFLIIGRKGNGTRYIEKLINQLGLEDRVIITGEISENKKIDLLHQSKYYFQVSKFEGFGIAALEAFFANNIIIHSKKGGLDNPIYQQREIVFDTDIPFDQAYLKFEQTLLDYKVEQYDLSNNIRYYSNQRRQNDFKNILK